MAGKTMEYANGWLGRIILTSLGVLVLALLTYGINDFQRNVSELRCELKESHRQLVNVNERLAKLEMLIKLPYDQRSKVVDKTHN